MSRERLESRESADRSVSAAPQVPPDPSDLPESRAGVVLLGLRVLMVSAVLLVYLALLASRDRLDPKER